MEFSAWLEVLILFIVPSYFADKVTREEAIAGTYTGYFIAIGIAVGLWLIFQVLMGFGIYTIAKRAGIKRPWMGFIPFANTYYLGTITGEARFFGQKMKRAGLYAAIAEGVAVLFTVFDLVCNLVFLQVASLEPVAEDIELFAGFNELTIQLADVPENLQWLCVFTASVWPWTFKFLVAVVRIVMLYVLFFAFFRKYYARNPAVMTVLSAVLPFRGATIFAVRKNTPVDYGEYTRRRMEAYAARNYPYGPGGSGTSSAQQPRQDDPFSDYPSGGGSSSQGDPPPDDPFSDL